MENYCSSRLPVSPSYLLVNQSADLNASSVPVDMLSNADCQGRSRDSAHQVFLKSLFPSYLCVLAEGFPPTQLYKTALLTLTFCTRTLTNCCHVSLPQRSEINASHSQILVQRFIFSTTMRFLICFCHFS